MENLPFCPCPNPFARLLHPANPRPCHLLMYLNSHCITHSFPELRPTPCSGNSKSTGKDGNNTPYCSDKGIVYTHPQKTQAVINML